MRRFWTADEIAVLRERYALINQPLHRRALAQQLGRSVIAITLKAGRMGFTSPLGLSRPRVEQLKIRVARFTNPEDRRQHQSEIARTRIAKNGHPRGALGLKHTADARAKMGAASRAAWADPASGFHSPEHRQRKSDHMLRMNLSGVMPARYSRTKGGARADLGGRYFRSSWEANYARWLNFLITRNEVLAWEYEGRTFLFEKIKRGTRAYTPDFKVTFPDGRSEWHEVKGWMDQKSKTRLKRMAKYYPTEQLVIIGKSWFGHMVRTGLAGAIPGWERR